jgi:hypothetical protein
MKKRESKLWQRIKNNVKQPHLIRLESNTINGIPDINGCWAGKEFWIELKSDTVSFPKLSKWQVAWINKRILAGGIVIICKEALSQRSLKLYRPLSAFSCPKKLKPSFVFSAPVPWPAFEDALWELLELPSELAREQVRGQRFANNIKYGSISLTDLDLARC